MGHPQVLFWCGVTKGYRLKFVLLEAAGAEAEDFALVGFQDLEEVAGESHSVAGGGDFAGGVAEETGDGGDGLVGVVAKADGEKFFDIGDGHASAEHQAAIGFANGIGSEAQMVGAAFADDFLDTGLPPWRYRRRSRVHR